MSPGTKVTIIPIRWRKFHRVKKMFFLTCAIISPVFIFKNMNTFGTLYIMV